MTWQSIWHPLQIEIGAPLELQKESQLGTFADATGGTFYIAVDAYSDGGYDIDTWSNESLDCTDLWGSQNDAGTGGDAPGNYTPSPTNMGSNVTATYTGCVDTTDEVDVFAFDVPLTTLSMYR